MTNRFITVSVNGIGRKQPCRNENIALQCSLILILDLVLDLYSVGSCF